MLPILVVDFDGFLSPMPGGWFDPGSYNNGAVKNVVKFLLAATEYFEIAIFGPRSLMFGGIQTMQAAIILWTNMEVNRATMHELMQVLRFPVSMPADVDVCINGTGVKWITPQDALDPESVDFILIWQKELAAESNSPMIR